MNTNVTIARSKINNNSLSQINNMNPADGALASGGGIFTEGGTLTITSTNLSNNKISANTSGNTALASGGAVGTNNTIVSVDRSKIEDNTLYTIATQVNTTQGSAFSATGGSLTVTGSIITGNIPFGNSDFSQTGASVVLTSSNVDGIQLPGSYKLGENGFTPDT